MADKKSRGLGRGLSALMADVAPKAEEPVSNTMYPGQIGLCQVNWFFQILISRVVRLMKKNWTS